MFSDELADLLEHMPEAAHMSDTGEPVTEPTRVFRVEMPNGRGPFNSGLGNGEEIYDKLSGVYRKDWNSTHLADNNGEQMGVTELGFKQAHGHAAYACKTIEDIRNWFPEGARRYLRDTWNATLVEYEIPKGGYMMEVGHGEVVFSKPDSRRVADHDLLEPEHAV